MAFGRDKKVKIETLSFVLEGVVMIPEMPNPKSGCTSDTMQGL